MSNQLHDGEAGRRKQVKFRADGELIERFDALVEQSEEYSSRAEALRASMHRMLGAADKHAAPRQPPTEGHLRTAYLTLVSVANWDGVIPHEIAVSELATTLGKGQQVIKQRHLHDLRQRGYLAQRANTYGERAWKLRGWDDAE